MIVRRCTMADLDGYLAVQEEEWGDSMSASRAQLASRLGHVGSAMLVLEHDGEVVGGASFVRLASYDIDEHLSWDELTDSGWCTNHDPNGPVLFGVDLTVSRRAPRAGSALLFAGVIESAIRHGVDVGYWGSRLPRYHRYAAEMTAADYARTTSRRGRYLDPEIQIYSRIPGVELIGVVPDYFKDPDSLDYGAVFEWRNPVRRYPFLRPLARPVVAAVYRRARRRNGSRG